MKINFSFALRLLLPITVFLPYRKTNLDSDASVIRTISIESKASPQSLSNFFNLEGHTTITSSAQHEVRGIDDIIISGNKLFILDNSTDFQNIWAFDISGSFIGNIGHESETQEDGFGGLNDFCLSNTGDEIIGLDAGKLSFKHYGLQGGLNLNLANGVYGENVEKFNDGSYVVYNEFGASDVSKYYHLIFFDKSGNLIKRMFSYPQKLEGMAFDFTGFLSRSSNMLWFCPPFSDTLYSVTKQGVTPEYYFNFGSSAIPNEFRENKMDGMDADNFAYLTSSFIKMGNLAVFEYFSGQRVNFGLFDDRNGAFLGFDDAKRDAFSELLRVGKIFPKDALSYSLVLNSNRIKYLIQKNKLDFEYFTKHHPKLLADLNDAASKIETTFIILHLAVNPDAPSIK